MSRALDPLRVLVVDGDPYARRIMLSILHGLGVQQVREASDAAEGLDMLRRGPADVAMVDYGPTPVDGIAFTLALRTGSNSPAPELPVVMIGARAGRSPVEAARDAGVNEFVSRPLTTQAVMDRLDAVVNRPRPFIRSHRYVGPDRRRRPAVAYPGPFRRAEDAGRATYDLDA